ncbi:MAG TPA: recombinase family protein [Rhizomicrobium sp.]|nr:recombinase family protein [Rhizomicrobium sp.]
MSNAFHSNPTTIRCIIYLRVSPTKRDHEGESFDTQEEICRRIARERGWQVAAEPWKDSFTGQLSERPELDRLLDFLEDHAGEIRYCIFRSIDRFSRGGSHDYSKLKRQLMRHGVELVDSYGIIQPSINTLESLGFEYSWSRVSPSSIAEVVVAEAVNKEVSDILTRMIGQEIRLTQRGYKIGPPNDGYINTEVLEEGRKRVIQTPDPDRAHFYRTMFTLRASGQWSDEQICKQINAMGFRTRIGDRWDRRHERVIGRWGSNQLTAKRLQSIIRRPIYAGVVCGKWTHGKPVKAAYPGLVSIATFNAANRGNIYIEEANGGLSLLYDHDPERRRPYRNRFHPLFPYRGIVGCSECRKPLYASSPRGKGGKYFPVYHCNRGHPYIGYRKRDLERAAHRFIQRIKFHSKSHMRVCEALLRLYDERFAELVEEAQHVERSVKELEAQKADTIRAFREATTAIVRQGLEAEAVVLEKEIERARGLDRHMKIDRDDIGRFLADVTFFLEHPQNLLNSVENPAQLKALHRFMWEAFPTYEELHIGTPKLRPIFSLSSTNLSTESVLVRLRGFGWNTIEQCIMEWKLDEPLLHAIAVGTSPKS